jgi:RNA polymerase sigma-70 factor (ECF subfamily)
MVSTKEELFRQYFEAYFERLFLYAFTLVRNNAEAKDIAQSSFIKLWEKRADVEFETSARSYLYTTVYHLSLNAARNTRLRNRHHQTLKAAAASVTEYNPEEKELRERIVRAVEQLPPRCKEVFLKSRMEGKKYAEIAKELDISEKTVEVQMGKALKYLKAQLRDTTLLLILLMEQIKS